MQTEPYPSRRSRLARRVAGATVLAGLAFLVLWLTVFNAVSAALAAASLGGGAIFAGSSSDVFQGLLEAVLDAVGGVLAALAGFVSSLFSFDG